MILLAWKFIKFDRSKSIGIVTAIVISIFLIGQQLGLLGFLMGLMGNLVSNANINERDIWVIENQTENVNVLNRIDQRYVQELRSIEGVAQTYPRNLPAPGRRQTLYILLRVEQSPVFLINSRLRLFTAALNSSCPYRAITVKGAPSPEVTEPFCRVP